MDGERPRGVAREQAVGDLAQPGGGVSREGDRPGEVVAEIAVAAAVQETAESSQRHPQGERGRDDVEERTQREGTEGAVEEEGGRAAHDAPVEDDPPLPDLEDIADRADLVSPVLDDVE